MLHHVHIYTITRVKVWNVEAETHKEAISRALDAFEKVADQLLPDRTSDSPPPGECVVELGGYAYDLDSFLVDEAGDENFERTSSYYARDAASE